MQAWQEEVERARQSQREAENKISSLEVPVTIFKYAVISKIKIGYVCAWQHGKFILSFWNWQAELQKMRVEMAGMKRDAEHYSRQVTFLRKLFNI